MIDLRELRLSWEAEKWVVTNYPRVAVISGDPFSAPLRELRLSWEAEKWVVTNYPRNAVISGDPLSAPIVSDRCFAKFPADGERAALAAEAASPARLFAGLSC